MKTRYCLGYKHLPFTTVWVEFPDIAGLIESKKIIASISLDSVPSPTLDSPSTLPAIEDPNTGAFIVDSLAIASYLDETYPDTPTVLSPAARQALDRAGDLFSFGSGGGALRPASPGEPDIAQRLVFLVLASERLNPVSREYYNRTRAAWLGEVWMAVANGCSASAEERAERIHQGIQAIKGTWCKVTALYDRADERERPEYLTFCKSVNESDTAGSFALGKDPCLLDFAVAGRIKFVLDGLTPSQMESMTSEGHRLLQLVGNLEKYFQYGLKDDT